jgi:uncharacterized repeat protein (TIGR02543 family)
MKNRRFRKRRIIIPCVLTAALLIAGEIYEQAEPVRIIDDVTPSSFAADSVPEEEPEIERILPREVRITFYAGDDAVTATSIKPNNKGGYKKLPQPEKDGYTFMGWYTERTGGERVSKTNSADIRDGATLYARWIKLSQDVDESVNGLPVLMYHWFYDTAKGDPRPTKLLNNWMEASQFEEEMAHLKEAGYYFPTWDEVYAYVRGEIDLPDKSIVITADDGKQSFYDYAIPIFEKHRVRGTGFVIAHKLTESEIKEYSSDFVSLQSHTWDMHGGAGGKSYIQIRPFEEAVADLASAAAVLGTSGGKVYPGMDPLRLPRVRISSSQSAAIFKQVYG